MQIGIILAAAMVVSPGLAAADDHENPYTGDPTAIEQGQRLWAKTGCYSCHGETAEGALGPDLTDDVGPDGLDHWQRDRLDRLALSGVAAAAPERRNRRTCAEKKSDRQRIGRRDTQICP